MVAWLGPAATLLGGLLSKPKPKYVVPDYAGIRKGAEAAGFNPLTALTQGPAGSVVDMAGGMGASIAEAGLMLADNLAKSSASSKLSQVQAQNAKLKAQVTNLTLRPKVAGIYAQRQAVPSLARALGASNAVSSPSGDVALPAGVGQGALFGVGLADPVTPKLTHTYQTYANDGQQTNVPIGPDFDEVLSGAVIADINRRKAENERRKLMDFGVPYGFTSWGLRDPIEMPPGYQPKYPKSKSERFWDWATGKNTSQGWPKFQLRY